METIWKRFLSRGAGARGAWAAMGTAPSRAYRAVARAGAAWRTRRAADPPPCSLAAKTKPESRSLRLPCGVAGNARALSCCIHPPCSSTDSTSAVSQAATPELADRELQNSEALRGKIAVVHRGGALPWGDAVLFCLDLPPARRCLPPKKRCSGVSDADTRAWGQIEREFAVTWALACHRLLLCRQGEACARRRREGGHRRV